MKRLYFTLTVLFSMAICASAQLQNATDTNIGKVKTANKTVTTISSKFKRTQNMAFLKSPVVTDGDFNYTKSDKLSMKYSNGEVLVINGETVVIGKKGKTRNVKSKNKNVEALASTLLSCMAGDISAIDGTLTATNKNSKTITFNVNVDFVVGKGKISKLEIVYDASDMTFRSINMIEGDGSYTLYELTDSKKVNTDIPASVYSTGK